MVEFENRYCKPGTPLARRGNGHDSSDVAAPNFTDWQVRLQAGAVEEYISEQDTSLSDDDRKDLRKLKDCVFLCCPEDVKCTGSAHEAGTLCLDCKFPICRSCGMQLQKGAIIPAGLGNDNWYGYIQEWIYEMGVTWMEKTVATPYWTGLTLFTVREQNNKRRHKLFDTILLRFARFRHRGTVLLEDA